MPRIGGGERFDIPMPPRRAGARASRKADCLDRIPFGRKCAYMLLIAIAPALLVWAYFDDYAREQDLEMARLRFEIQRLADQQEGPFVLEAGKLRPPMPEGWSTAEGDAYLIDLPPGYALSIGDGGFDYIHSIPREEDDLLPYAVIRELPASEEEKYAALEGRILLDGDRMFWMYLYENLEWKEFDQAAASLRLK
jgi:hypothetical protein